MSSSKRFIVLYFTWYLANFEFFINQAWSLGRDSFNFFFFFFAYWCSSLALISFAEQISLFLYHCPNPSAVDALLLPWQLSVLLPILYCLDYCSDIRSLKIMKCNSYELFPSFYTLFYGNSFAFPKNFENQFAYIYKKNPAGNVTETSINLLIKLRRWFPFYQFYLL